MLRDEAWVEWDWAQIKARRNVPSGSGGVGETSTTTDVSAAVLSGAVGDETSSDNGAVTATPQDIKRREICLTDIWTVELLGPLMMVPIFLLMGAMLCWNEHKDGRG